MTERSIETRYTAGVVEMRAATGGKRAGGYAIVWNRLSQNLGGFVERVDPSAANKSLADGVDVLARYNHDGNLLLGRTSSGTLRLEADGTGLGYEVDLPDTTAGRDIAVLMERGDVRHSSFAMRVMDDDWSLTEQGFPLRTITDLHLVDVAPVNSPAYLDTSSGLRSLAETRGVDFDDVVKAARANALAEIVRTTTTIVDLAPAQREAEKPAETPAAPTALQVYRARDLHLMERRTS
jgi:HK97 family phage prohead protease